MRFSLEWLSEFVGVADSPRALAARLSSAGLEVSSVETLPAGPEADGAADTILEIDITANRPDALSHFGLAREIAALCGWKLRLPACTLVERQEPAGAAASVVIEAGDLCRRYVGRVVRGVRVGESPAWLQGRLRSVGLAPKNNVVDASNFVLFELGQPLHTFDLARLAGRGVTVRRARAGERIVTVADREVKQLEPEMLVIAESGGRGAPGRPAAIAGVMGGFESAISDSTSEILIESAWFDPASVRRTARALGLRTDASHRFERGADPTMTRFAADRLASLIADLAGGEVLRGAIDVVADGAPPSTPSRGAPGGPAGPAPADGEIRSEVRYEPVLREGAIPLRSGAVSEVLGVVARDADVAQALARFSIEVTSGEPEPASPRATPRPRPPGAPVYSCRVPAWRWDLVREIDLIEEYARFIGYDAIPETLPRGIPPLPRLGPGAVEDRVREMFVSCGYREAITYSMISSSDDLQFGPLSVERGSGGGLKIENPLSDRWEVLRRSLIAGLSRALAYNQARGRRDLRLFEVGTVHDPRPGGFPRETRAVALGGSGLGDDPAWPAPARPYDLFDLKGALQALAEALGGPAERLVFSAPDPKLVRAPSAAGPGAAGGPEPDPARAEGETAWPFHPAQSFVIARRGRIVGRGGRLNAALEKAIESDRPQLLAEMSLEPFLAAAGRPRFSPLPRLNPVERDLSFVVDSTVAFAEVEAAVEEASREAATLLSAAEVLLIDRFEGGSIPQGKVSYAFRFRFVQRDRAHTAEELQTAVERIARGLVARLHAEIRSR